MYLNIIYIDDKLLMNETINFTKCSSNIVNSNSKNEQQQQQQPKKMKIKKEEKITSNPND